MSKGPLEFKVELSVTENGRKAPQYTLDTDLAGEITLASLLEFTKSSLIIIAHDTLREEQANGFDKNPVVTVDGRVGKAVINVHPLGKIEFTARANLDTMLLEIYDAIESRSPVDTGLYKKSNYVLLNTKQIANDRSSLNSWILSNPTIKSSDVIRFINIQPYARKLETLGVTAGNEKYSSRSTRWVDSRRKGKINKGGPKIQAPNGAYFLASRAIRRKFKKNANINFGFMQGSLLGIKGNFSLKGGRGGSQRANKKPPRSYLYPTISVRFTQGGLD